MSSLQSKFDFILKKYGHNVLLRKERNGNVAWERHTVRSRYPAFRGVPSIREEQIEGIIHTVDMIFYFRWDAYPREGDIIYEEDVRYEDDHAHVQWVIDYAVPQREAGGRIAYYIAGVTRNVPN